MFFFIFSAGAAANCWRAHQLTAGSEQDGITFTGINFLSRVPIVKLLGPHQDSFILQSPRHRLLRNCCRMQVIHAARDVQPGSRAGSGALRLQRVVPSVLRLERLFRLSASPNLGQIFCFIMPKRRFSLLLCRCWASQIWLLAACIPKPQAEDMHVVEHATCLHSWY